MSIPNFPNESNAGRDFDYSNWTPGTLIRLSRVPWSMDYRDVVVFETGAQRSDYLTSGPSITFEDSVYHKPGDGVRIPVPINVVNTYNYLEVHNPKQPLNEWVAGVDDEPERFYYFITGAEYLSPNTTMITAQLDVWQTYAGHRYDSRVEFGNAFVERGHLGIANSDAMRDRGRTYLTEPEGMDIGSSYIIRERAREDMASARTDGTNGDYAILIASTVELETDLGSVDDPTIETAHGSYAQGLPNGAKFYVIEEHVDLRNILTYLSIKPWASQGIVSLTAVPSLSRYNLLSTMDEVWIGTGDGTGSTDLGGSAYIFPRAGYTPATNEVDMIPNFRDVIESHIPSRYRHLDKFKTSPYSVLELTTYNGQPIIIKPETWNAEGAYVAEMANIIPPGQKVAVYPKYVNSNLNEIRDDRGLMDDGGEFLDMATNIPSFPQFTIVTNQGIAYLAQNSSSIAYQRESADWAQQRAMQGAQTAFDQSSNAISSTEQQSKIAQDIARQQTEQQNAVAGQQALSGGIAQAGGGAIGGAMMGGGVGAVMGGIGGAANAAVGYGIETSNNSAQLAISNQATRRNTANQTQSMRFNRDTNKNYADFAAKGDYENAIAGINAKVQDIQNMPPSTAGQVGGEAFNLAMHAMGYTLKLKMIDEAALNRIGEHWLRFGYAVNRFTSMPSSPAELRLMSRFTYWKVKELNVRGSIPEHFRQAIRGILEKGVTVWNDPDDIGFTDPGQNSVNTSTTIGW